MTKVIQVNRNFANILYHTVYFFLSQHSDRGEIEHVSSLEIYLLITQLLKLCWTKDFAYVLFIMHAK